MPHTNRSLRRCRVQWFPLVAGAWQSRTTHVNETECCTPSASRVNDHGLNIVAGLAGRFNDQAWGQFELAGTPTKLAEFKNFLEKEKTLTAEGWKPDPAVVRDLFFRIPDRVGLLNDITAACAEAGFGIGHLYCTLEVEVPSGKEWARMYVQLEVPSDRRHLLPNRQSQAQGTGQGRRGRPVQPEPEGACRERRLAVPSLASGPVRPVVPPQTGTFVPQPQSPYTERTIMFCSEFFVGDARQLLTHP